MKKFVFIIIALIASSKITTAQQIQWAKIYTDLGGHQTHSYSFIELKDSGFIIVGFYQDTLGFPGYSFAIRINKYGDTLWTHKYTYANANYFSSIDAITDSTFVCFGGFNFPGQSNLSLGVINFYGDTILHRYYAYQPSDYPLRIKHCFDRGYIMNIGGYSPNDIIKLDSNFNIQWSLTMGACSKVVQDIDSGFVAVGSSGLGSKKYGVVRIDKNGSIVWYNALGNMPSSPDTYYATDVKIMSDSNYLISSNGTDWQMMKLNRNSGDTMWTKTYSDSLYGFDLREITRIDFAGNNKYICAFYRACNGIMLINGNDGDTIWAKKNPLFYIITDVKKTSDGGFAYCGSTGSSFQDHMCFVKLDSLGNTVYTSIVNFESNQLINFYPNPASAELNITTNNFASVKNVIVTLTDMQGKQVLQQEYSKEKAVDVSCLPNGIYVAEVRGKEKVIRGKVVVQH